MSKDPQQHSNANAGNGGEKVPETGSHEDFGQNTGTDAPGGKTKSGGKEETGATEAGNEDKGAKL